MDDADIINVWLLVYSVATAILFTIQYFVVRTHQNDLYHTLYREKESQKKEDLEIRKRQITETFRTQLEIRQTKQALEQVSSSSEVDKATIDQLLSQLRDDYTSANLSTIADIESRQGNFEKALDYINKAIEIDFENPELWRQKSSLLNTLGRAAEEQEAKSRYVEFLNNANFRKNLKQKIVLQEIEFQNLPFYGSFVWTLKPTINVLLGKNGYGKSHLLSIVLAQLQEETASLLTLSRINNSATDLASGKSFIRIKLSNGDTANSPEVLEVRKQIQLLIEKKRSIQEKLNQESKTAADHARSLKTRQTLLNKVSAYLDEKCDQDEHLSGRSLFDKTGSIRSTFGKIPVLAIPDLRFVNKSVDSTTTSIADEKAKKLLDFGAYHFINQLPYENAIQNFLNSICNIYYSDGKTFSDEIFQLINRIFYSLAGSEFRWVEIVPTQDNSGNIIRVQTEGNDEVLPIQKVSQGTLSVISIAGLVFHYLSLRYPDVGRKDLAKQQGIVVIDEIDAHLHPSWQQKLIGILRREFPNIQFIITAHSPLVVGGCKEDEVAVMRENRTADNKRTSGFFVEKLFEDFLGYSTGELYKRIFEIVDKDENYLRYVSLIPGRSELEAELIVLEEKQSRTTLTSEEAARMSELRDDLYYIDKVKQKAASTPDIEQLTMQNEMLKMELEIRDAGSRPQNS